MEFPTPKQVINQWFERVWNARESDAIPEMMTDEAVAHLAGGAEVLGKNFAQFHNMLLAAFPDLTVRLLRSVGDETQACLHWEVTGTQKGEFAGIAATNKKVRFAGMSFVIVRDGKITEGWDCWDYGALTTTLSSPSI